MRPEDIRRYQGLGPRRSGVRGGKAKFSESEDLTVKNDALTTYLQDHLAGALHAIELLKAMRDHFAGEPLGTFADEVLAEVEADREVLARLTERVGGTVGRDERVGRVAHGKG